MLGGMDSLTAGQEGVPLAWSENAARVNEAAGVKTRISTLEITHLNSTLGVGG